MDDYIFGGALKADNIKLYTQSGEEIWDLGSGDCELTIPISAESDPPVIHSITTNHTAEFSADICEIDISTFRDLSRPSTMPIRAYYDIPIMIQVRWHKKNRINKKWLKRYGMKPDVIKVEMNIRELTYEPGHIVDKDEIGIRSTFDSWNFKTDMLIYKYRPDQMRKNLKIQ